MKGIDLAAAAAVALAVAMPAASASGAGAVAPGAGASRSSTETGVLPASAFVGRWRGGEGTYMKISRRGDRLAIDNRWGLDADMQGVFTGTITAAGLRFRRNGAAQVVRPSRGDAVARSALAGKRDCLMVSRSEGYCRY